MTMKWLRELLANPPEDRNSCWLWPGYVQPDSGRPQVALGLDLGVIMGQADAYAYRITYRILHGPIPNGLELDHLCFNPTCVNPWHLEPVTHEENMRREMARREYMKGSGRRNRTSTFGSVDKRATGYRARYWGPDGRRHQAPTMFLTKAEARGWLALRQSEIIRKAWQPPEVASPNLSVTFANYAETWLKHRQLKERTRAHYRWLLDEHLIPEFGKLSLASITADDVRDWHSGFGTKTPTLRTHCYGLLRTILGTAASEGKAPANPCVLRGAGSVKRKHQIRPASLPELTKLTEAMPEPYQAMIPLASWCAMRFGELTELRRKDVILDPDTDKGVIRIERAVVRVKLANALDSFAVTTPKSDAGTRDVAIPPHLVGVIADHLVRHVGPRADALLFPAAHGGHLAPATLYRHWYKARDAAGRPDLRFHDLRHSGAVLAALSGATLAELMGRLGHSTPAAALRYQHVAAGRDEAIAAALSKIALGEG
jgi:integrase